MALPEIIQEDLRSIENALGNPTFSWSNQTYACIPATVENQLLLEDGGFQTATSLVLKCRREVFTDGNIPESQDTITFNGVSYRVDKVRQDVFNAMVVIHLVNPNRGA